MDTNKDQGSNKSQSQQKSNQGQGKPGDRSREQSDALRDQERADRSPTSTER